MKALLIIDMQNVSFTPATPRFDAENVVKRINALAERFRQHNDKVIFIQHDGSKENECLPGTDEWKILDSLYIDTNDYILSKTANDSFYRTNLHQILQDSAINELIVTGCATDFCVDATIKSALSLDYCLSVISNAHTTADRPHISAEKLITHYNWMWKEMIPTKGNVEVIPFEKYISL